MAIAVVLVPTDKVCGMWPTCSRLLAEAIKYSGNRTTSGMLLDSLLEAVSQLWIMVDTSDNHRIVACGISGVRPYETPMLNVFMVGGTRMEEWLDTFIGKLKMFASHNSCKRIEFFGRSGWLRVLGKRGFKQSKAIMMELSLV